MSPVVIYVQEGGDVYTNEDEFAFFFRGFQRLSTLEFFFSSFACYWRFILVFFFFVSFKPILVGMLLKNERSKPKAV